MSVKRGTTYQTMGVILTKQCNVKVEEETRTVKVRPASLHSRSEMLDGLQEVSGTEEVTVPLPDNVDVTFARAYVRFIQDLIPPPFASDPNRYTSWDAVDRFLGCNLSQYPGSTWMQELYAANPDMGKNASLEWIRRRTVFNKADTVVNDPHMFLMRVGDVTEKIKLDFEHCCIVKPETARLIPNATKLRTGCERLRASLPGFPWFADDGKQGAIIAGGRTVALLHNTVLPGQDVDIFVVAPSVESANTLLDRIIKSIRGAHKHARVAWGRYTVDIDVFERVDTKYVCVEKFQIIMRVFASPSHVVHGFDIDLCGILYDGKNTWCTHNAARALANGFNLLDENKLSSSAVFRYAKYARVYGYAVLAAGVPQEFMATPLARCLTDTSNNTGMDVFNVLHLMQCKEWAPASASRDYNAVDFEENIWFRLQRTTVPFSMMSMDTDVFTGAFNPVKADTLMRFNKYAK